MTGGLLLRGEEADLAERAMAETRRAAWLSTVRHGVLVLGGWAFGACATAAMCFALYELHHRPVMPPQVYVSIVWADRRLPPRLRDDLAAGERQVVREKVMADYVRCREEYVWPALRRCYRHVSAMSAPDVRDAYQRRMNDQQDPDAPQQRYGAGGGAGSARIPGDIAVFQDAREPNHFVASYVVVEERPGKPVAQVRRVARLAFDDGRRRIPYDLQREFSPLGDLIVWYVTEPDQARPLAAAASPNQQAQQP